MVWWLFSCHFLSMNDRLWPRSKTFHIKSYPSFRTISAAFGEKLQTCATSEVLIPSLKLFLFQITPSKTVEPSQWSPATGLCIFHDIQKVVWLVGYSRRHRNLRSLKWKKLQTFRCENNNTSLVSCSKMHQFQGWMSVI